MGRGIAYAYRSQTVVAQIAELEVNRRTGHVWVKRMVCAHDCGLVIDPEGLRRTLECGMLHSRSRALHEEVRFDREKVTSLDWVSHPTLTHADTPERIDLVIVNGDPTQGRPDLPHYGAGETVCKPTLAAVGTAIFDATGVRAAPRAVPRRARAGRARDRDRHVRPSILKPSAPWPVSPAAPPMEKIIVHAKFHAGHRQVGYSGVCRFVHGHTWRGTVAIATEEFPRDDHDMSLDFGAVKQVLRDLDHKMLVVASDTTLLDPALFDPDGIVVLEGRAPSVENVAHHVFDRVVELIRARYPERGLAYRIEVTIQETDNNLFVVEKTATV